MQHSKAYAACLVVTAALCGALVPVIGMLVSRVIGPVFGFGWFAWTGLIAVMLAALAAGYAMAGHKSERNSSPDWLYGIVMAAGAWMILLPALRGPVLQMSLPLGLHWGSLAGTVLLFGPALLLPGCALPGIVKSAAREVCSAGGTAGGCYAIAASGSVALLAGFALVAYLGANQIFQFAGSLLIVLGVVYFLAFRRKWAVVFAVILPLLPLPHPVEKVTADGTRVERIAERDGFGGNLKVLDYSYQARHNRELIRDGMVQGGVDMNNGLSVYEPPYLLQFMPYAINPDGKNCLVVGLGAGLVPAWYRAQGVNTEVVEHDDAVIELARKYFAFAPAITVHAEDARNFLTHTAQQRYDYLILDAFSGDTAPGRLLSVEAMRLVKQRLAENGVVAVNLVGSVKRDTLMTASVVKTMRNVFDQVTVYPTFDPAVGDGTGNLVIVAYDGGLRPLQFSRLNNLAIHPAAESLVRLGMERPFLFPAQTPAQVISDDDNPLESYGLWLRERMIRDMLDSTDFDILFG
ncbi:MAG: fused MFS/spermidine synthase [Nitrosomonadales bacterium]|nr:fused MFS/spermidine synthase [Nitrosomonadales bacterium]